MKRCLETAEILFPEKLYEHVPRIQKAGLSECDFGTFEYKNYLELSGDAEYQYFIDTLGREGFPGGETTERLKPGQWRHFRKYGRKFFLRLNRGLTGHSFLSFMEERSCSHGGVFGGKEKLL